MMSLPTSALTSSIRRSNVGAAEKIVEGIYLASCLFLVGMTDKGLH